MKNKNVLILIFILIFLAVVGYNISSRTAISKTAPQNTVSNISESKGMTRSTVLPSYKIVQIRVNNSKLLLMIVRLKEKINESELNNLANFLKTKVNPNAYKATIDFILPNMQPTNGAWAIAYFNPNLQINYVTTTKEEDLNFDKKNVSKDYVGVWENSAQTYIIIKKISPDRYIFNYVSATDINEESSDPINLKKVKRNGQTIYIEDEEGSTFYYKINQHGDLLIYNHYGLESQLKKIK